MKLIACIDFNRADDKEEYGTSDKVVSVYRFKEEGEQKVCFTFELGRRADDTLTLTFGVEDIVTKIALCKEEK